MASYFITEYRIYNTLDSDSTVLEKCNIVHEKSLKSPWILFLKKCGNHAPYVYVIYLLLFCEISNIEIFGKFQMVNLGTASLQLHV